MSTVAKKSKKKGLTDAEKAAKKAERQANKVPRSPFRQEGANLLEGSDHKYDSKTQFGPKKADFKFEYDFLDWKAKCCEAQATSFREQAEESRTMGSGTDRAKAKKLRKFMSEAENIRAELVEAVGEEKVDALLATMAKGK